MVSFCNKDMNIDNANWVCKWTDFYSPHILLCMARIVRGLFLVVIQDRTRTVAILKDRLNFGEEDFGCILKPNKHW